MLQTTPQPDASDGYEFLFGDDLALTARDEVTCNRVEQQLLRFFGQPELGPLTLNRKAAGHSGSFEYLGYEFRHDGISQKWVVDLSQRNWVRMARKRHAEVVNLHARNPHGIVNDDMQSVRKMLPGFSALTDPESLLLQMRDIGPK